MLEKPIHIRQNAVGAICNRPHVAVRMRRLTGDYKSPLQRSDEDQWACQAIAIPNGEADKHTAL